MKRLSFLFCCSFIALINCEKVISPLEVFPKVCLENQHDHNGITITVVEADTSVYTASDGSYTLPQLANGNWTLRAFYPWYFTEKQTVTIANGKPIKPIVDLTLKQEIIFGTSTERPSYKLGDTIEMTLVSRNISDLTITLQTHSAAMEAFAVRKNGQTVVGRLMPGLLGIVVTKTFQPGGIDTISLKWNTASLPPPETGTFKIYMALITEETISKFDATEYWGYFGAVDFLSDSTCFFLNESLFSKLVPTIVTITQ